MKNINEVTHYIRKNRETTAMIYLKENDQKIAQKLFCYIYACDKDYKVVGEITNLDEAKDCDLVLVANADVFERNTDEHYKVEKELKRKGIKLKIAIDETNEEEYIEKALDLFRKV